jgi:aminocyclopropanecarboxylate oxidase
MILIRMQLENHGVDAAIMEDVKRFVHGHYEEHLEAKFHASDLARNLDAADAGQVDWEAAYSIQHRPTTNIADFPEISPPTRYVVRRSSMPHTAHTSSSSISY